MKSSFVWVSSNDDPHCRSPPRTLLETFSMSPPVKLELELILKEIRTITDKIKEDDTTATISGDWKFAAMVLDRCSKEQKIYFLFCTKIFVYISPVSGCV